MNTTILRIDNMGCPTVERTNRNRLRAADGIESHSEHAVAAAAVAHHDGPLPPDEAFAGLARPWMAVLADLGDSPLVVANGLRRLRHRDERAER